MKVGIISMQKVYNYGSFLQAYSLKKNIEALGHECEFIDIKPGEKVIEEAKKRKTNFLSKFDKYFFRRIKHYYFSKHRNKNFKDIYLNWLGISDETNWDQHFDVVIIGSDEVFNCTQSSKWGLSPNLFGGDINSDKIITYAASCGYTTYEKIKELGLEYKISKLLSNIESFSVRDKNTAIFVKKLTGKEPLYHLDPVFIYDFNNEIKERKLNYSYVLIYAYDGRINAKNEIKAIQQFARENKLVTLSAGLYQSWCDRNISADPFELLGYFKNAEYIVTDTFHGTVLSIKYNKQFATIIRESNIEKITDLLNNFNLKERIVFDINSLSYILKKTINHNYINQLIAINREKSINYLKRNLSIGIKYKESFT